MSILETVRSANTEKTLIKKYTFIPNSELEARPERIYKTILFFQNQTRTEYKLAGLILNAMVVNKQTVLAISAPILLGMAKAAFLEIKSIDGSLYSRTKALVDAFTTWYIQPDTKLKLAGVIQITGKSNLVDFLEVIDQKTITKNNRAYLKLIRASETKKTGAPARRTRLTEDQKIEAMFDKISTADPLYYAVMQAKMGELTAAELTKWLDIVLSDAMSLEMDEATRTSYWLILVNAARIHPDMKMNPDYLKGIDKDIRDTQAAHEAKKQVDQEKKPMTDAKLFAASDLYKNQLPLIMFQKRQEMIERNEFVPVDPTYVPEIATNL
jgi:hypothetical protein